jgi:hypothetical protein
LPRAALFASALIGVSCLSASASAASVGVSTYHNDTLRTGWNPAETVLTPQTVASAAFSRWMRNRLWLQTRRSAATP